MSPLFSKRATYPGDPYAEAKASHRTAYGAKDPYWSFHEKAKGQQVNNSTGDPYAGAKELQQRVAP